MNCREAAKVWLNCRTICIFKAMVSVMFLALMLFLLSSEDLVDMVYRWGRKKSSHTPFPVHILLNLVIILLFLNAARLPLKRPPEDCNRKVLPHSEKGGCVAPQKRMQPLHKKIIHPQSNVGSIMEEETDAVGERTKTNVEEIATDDEKGKCDGDADELYVKAEEFIGNFYRQLQTQKHTQPRYFF